MLGVPLIRHLLPYATGPDLRCVTHPQFVPDLSQQVHQPMSVSCRLHTDQRRHRKLPIKPLGIARGLDQLPFPGFPCLRIQPTHLLPAGMKITSYNHHAKAPSSPASLVLNFRLPGPIQPSLLSNQFRDSDSQSGRNCSTFPSALQRVDVGFPAVGAVSIPSDGIAPCLSLEIFWPRLLGILIYW